MIEPTVEDVIGAVIATLERDIAPNVTTDDDGYTASLCRTVGQLLKAARSRLQHEEAMLIADNADLRNVLSEWAPALPPQARQRVEQALAEADAAAESTVARLQEEAKRLRAALVVLIEAIPGKDHPARAAGREYLQRQLERERPWMVDAFDGPRR